MASCVALLRGSNWNSKYDCVNTEEGEILLSLSLSLSHTHTHTHTHTPLCVFPNNYPDPSRQKIARQKEQAGHLEMAPSRGQCWRGPIMLSDMCLGHKAFSTSALS
jgi:hypothetical protein